MILPAGMPLPLGGGYPMPIVFRCPNCGKNLKAPNLPGKYVNCSGCSTAALIPNQADDREEVAERDEPPPGPRPWRTEMVRETIMLREDATDRRRMIYVIFPVVAASACGLPPTHNRSAWLVSPVPL